MKYFFLSAGFHTPVRGRQIIYKKILSESWSLSFYIKPFGVRPGWSNVLHATTGGDNGVYGYRTPGVWMISNSRRLHICSAVNGNPNYCWNSQSLPANKFTQVEIRQIPKFGPNSYYFQVLIDNTLKHEILNKQPSIFHNVRYYLSDPWYKPAKAHVRNFNVFNIRHPGQIIKCFTQHF